MEALMIKIIDTRFGRRGLWFYFLPLGILAALITAIRGLFAVFSPDFFQFESVRSTLIFIIGIASCAFFLWIAFRAARILWRSRRVAQELSMNGFIQIKPFFGSSRTYEKSDLLGVENLLVDDAFIAGGLLNTDVENWMLRFSSGVNFYFSGTAEGVEELSNLYEYDAPNQSRKSDA
jgi:amino acid transporter